MGAIFQDLASAAEKRVGRWCLQSCHCPRGSSWYWTLPLWVLGPTGHYEVALPPPPRVFLVERHILVRSSLLERGYHMDAIHLPLACFLEGSEWPSCERSSCDCFYFPNHILWGLERVILVPGHEIVLAFISIPNLVGLLLLHIILQFFFPYQLLYLFF